MTQKQMAKKSHLLFSFVQQRTCTQWKSMLAPCYITYYLDII